MSSSASPAPSSRSGTSTVRNSLVLASLAQAYAALAGIVVMPGFLHLLEPDVFGLVGVFLLLQGWIQLLDLGVPTVIAREFSLRGSQDAAGDRAMSVFRLLGTALWAAGILAAALLAFSADWLAAHWLTPGRLGGEVVAYCIALMGVAGGARIASGCYRGGLIGLQRHGLTTTLQIFGATARFPGALLFASVAGGAATDLFRYIAVAHLLELLAYRQAFRWCVDGPAWKITSDLSDLSKELLPICAAMAMLSALWVVTTQFDRLMLSSLLSLEAFGDYTVVISAAGGILLLLPVCNQILQPRLTRVISSENAEAGERLYRSVTQLASAGFFSLGGALAVFAEPILAVWTGDQALAVRAEGALSCYAVAFTFSGLLSVPFMLQFAAGYLRLHLIASTAFAAATVPIIYLSARFGGVEATGLALLLVNLVFLLFWVPVVHQRLLPACRADWFLRDLLPACVLAVGTLLLARHLLPESGERLPVAVFIVSSTGLAFLVALGVAPRARALLQGHAWHD